MCSESMPKEFEKTTEVLPFSKYGLSTMEEFKTAESDLQHLEKLKRAGLTDLEIKLYQENETGTLDQKKIESNVLKDKLGAIYDKIRKIDEESDDADDLSNNQPGTSDTIKLPDNLPTYPEGHPMNNIKEMEQNLFSHLRNDEIPTLNKRRKILRRFERRKERLLANDPTKQCFDTNIEKDTEKRPGSKWDIQEMPVERSQAKAEVNHPSDSDLSANDPSPRDRPSANTRPIYTIRDNKIVRVPPQNVERLEPPEETNTLLEGTKMSVDDIKKIEGYKDYEPGIPCQILELKNISTSVSEEQLKLLFNQFLLGNGGPVAVQLKPAQGTCTALVRFQNEATAIQALEETNGTIVSGRPIVAYFKNIDHRYNLFRRGDGIPMGLPLMPIIV